MDADEIEELTIDQKMVIAVQEMIDTYGHGYVATRAELKDFILDKYNIAAVSYTHLCV